MGKLKVIKSGPLALIQDKGRFGFRKYGIPQSGAMDMQSMRLANQLVGNGLENPIIEFALTGLKLEALEPTSISIVGAQVKLNGSQSDLAAMVLGVGDQVEVAAPSSVYGYIGIGGKLHAQDDFGSCSTYLLAGFGGIKGQPLQAGDIVQTIGNSAPQPAEVLASSEVKVSDIRILKGPEWHFIEGELNGKIVEVEPSSNRIGVRLKGEELRCSNSEIKSAAVIPGTIQRLPNGQLIVLLNDCQTTGGYPRVAQVVEEDVGKLSQVKAGLHVRLLLD